MNALRASLSLVTLLGGLAFACGGATEAAGPDGDPSCPVTSSGERTSTSATPGSACSVQGEQCFTYAVGFGAFMRCCSGEWQTIGGDAGFDCPK